LLGPVRVTVGERNHHLHPLLDNCPENPDGYLYEGLGGGGKREANGKKKV